MKSPPPIPAKILEDLKDYPDCIERLQSILNKIAASPLKQPPPLDMALWALEDTLDSIYVKAAKQAREAEARGDIPAMLAFKKKASAVVGARARMGDLSALFKYFGEEL